MRRSVELSRTPGTRAAPMTTRSKTFHPSRKNERGRGQYAAKRMQSSTTKMPRQTAFVIVRPRPNRSSIES